MRKILEGKVCDTYTAEFVADHEPIGVYPDDFNYFHYALYKTPLSAWFLIGGGWNDRNGFQLRVA